MGLVGNSKPPFQSNLVAKLTKERGAEGVDRSAFHSISTRAEVLETRRDFLRCPVGKREGKNSRGIQPLLLDKESNALDETKGLSRAWAGEHEQRREVSLDGTQLRG